MHAARFAPVQAVELGDDSAQPLVSVTGFYVGFGDIRRVFHKYCQLFLILTNGDFISRQLPPEFFSLPHQLRFHDDRLGFGLGQVAACQG